MDDTADPQLQVLGADECLRLLSTQAYPPGPSESLWRVWSDSTKPGASWLETAS